jgi:hypothetical protein
MHNDYWSRLASLLFIAAEIVDDFEICLFYGWQFLKQVKSFISINLLPSVERDMVLFNTRGQKEAQAHFDSTSLVDLNEHRATRGQ